MAPERENRPGGPEAFLANRIQREEAWKLYEALGEIGAIPRQPTTKKASRGVLIEWGRQDNFPLTEVAAFFRSQLTPKGEKEIQARAEEANLNLQKDSDFLNVLQMIIPKEAEKKPEIVAVEEPLGIEIDKDLEEAWRKGPSSVIAEQITQQLDRAMGKTKAGKIPLIAWLSNPLATLEALKAIADEATARATARLTISETTTWLAKMAKDDTKRDALLNYMKNLEEALGNHVELFCKARNILVPEEGSPERMVILLKINGDMRILNTRADEITENEEKLVEEREGIRAETARNQMIVWEKPKAIEMRIEVNTICEREVAQKLTHWTTLVVGTPAAAIVGSFLRVPAMIIEAGGNAVAEHQQIAIPLAIGIISFGFLSAEALSSGVFLESLGPISLGSGVVTGVTAMGTIVGWGLAKSWAKRKEQEEQEGEEKKYAIRK